MCCTGCGERCFLRPYLLVSLVAVLYVGAVLAMNGGDPLTLVVVGTRFDPGVPGGSMGYDGQFAYQMACDPLHGWQKMDNAAYRYQRLFYPLAAGALALGQAAWLPWTLALVNLIALPLGTAVLESLLVQRGVSRWYALAYGLNVGMLMAARLDLHEPLAFLLFGAGALAWARDKRLWSALWFGLAALTKEVTLVLIAGYALAWLAEGPQWRRAAAWGALAFGPFAVWQIVLRLWLGQWGVGSGGAFATPFEVVPLRGWWKIALIDWQVFVVMSALVVPLAIGPALAALALAGRDLIFITVRSGKPDGFWPETMALGLQAALMLFLPTSNILDPLGLSRFLVGLIVALLLYGARAGNKRVLLYSQLWIVTVIFIIGDNFLPSG